MDEIKTINGMKVTDTDAATKTELNTAVEGLATIEYVDTAVASGGSGGGIPTYAICGNGDDGSFNTEANTLFTNIANNTLRLHKDFNLFIQCGSGYEFDWGNQVTGAVYKIDNSGSDIKFYSYYPSADGNDDTEIITIGDNGDGTWMFQETTTIKHMKDTWTQAGDIMELEAAHEFKMVIQRDNTQYTFYWVAETYNTLSNYPNTQFGYFNGTATGGVMIFNDSEWTITLSDGDTFVRALYRAP